MAYSINGKTYSSHPLMDEIIYNCKLILNGIVLKNSEKANELETVNSVENSDMFLGIMNGSVSLGFFPLTASWLAQHGFDYGRANFYANNKDLLPKYVTATLKRYNSNNGNIATWNARECRYEFEDGQPAGYNINIPVKYNEEEKRFEYYNGEAVGSDVKVIGFTVPYYTTEDGNILFEHEVLPNTYVYANGGKITNSTPIYCMEGLFKEYANDYEYNEENNYYRTLNGRPNFKTIENDIYLAYDVKKEVYYTYTKDESGMETTHYEITVPENDEFLFDINPNLPLHEYQTKIIDTYEALNVMPQIRDLYLKRNKIDAYNYRYLNYLGSKRISVYTARKGAEWDILYMPACEHLVSDRFKELYKINRDIYYRRTYQLAYSTQSEYYDEMLMLAVVAQTFADMIVDTPEWYIRRDIFDLRSVQYFLESHGVAFYEEIPLRYQILIVKNLNKLIKYKSTDKNINDIISIFSAKDAVVYEYYILKKYLYNVNEVESSYNDEGSVDNTGWFDTGLIINGTFETGDTEGWNISMPGSYNYDKSSYGYKVTMNEFSTGGNITFNLSFWNNTSENHEFSLSQDVQISAGKYRLSFKQAGLENISGLSIYANDIIIHTQGKTAGDDKWETITISEFELESLQTVTIKFSGNINAGYSGNIDNITLYDYREIVDCGDEEEWEGPMPMTEAPFEFYDENSNEEVPTRRYLYDFGNEDADEIISGETSDAYTDNEEKDRIIYDESGNVYKLEFVRVPLGENYDDYIKDNVNREDYDVITTQDKYWDGEDTHYYVRNKHLEKQFTIEGTKYMSLRFNISMKDYNYQRAYFLGMFFNSDIEIDTGIEVPFIRSGVKFPLKDLFMFLHCCNGLFIDQPVDIEDKTLMFIKDKEKGDFIPFTDYNGGRPWDQSEEDPITPPSDPEWEVPDLDFGDHDRDPDSDFIRDQYTKYYDFGYQININYSDSDLYRYDYEEITLNGLDSGEEAIEIDEDEVWPPKDLLDFGSDDDEFIYRNKYTKQYEFYRGENEEDWWQFDTQDPDEIVYYYDYGADTVATYELIPYIDPLISEDEWYPYYIQNNDFSVLMYYEFDTDLKAYTLTQDYSSAPIPTEPWDYDIKVIITKENWKKYIGHYVIDMATGQLTKLTKDNWMQFLGLQRLLYPWHFEASHIYTIDLDGHYVAEDESDYNGDVWWNSNNSEYIRVDGEDVNGKISQIRNEYRLEANGGLAKYTSDSTSEVYYDWLRYNHPELWVKIAGRIFGFNMNANLDNILETISMRHSAWRWRNVDEEGNPIHYTLEDVGLQYSVVENAEDIVKKFIIKKKYVDIDELKDVYLNNTECYNRLMDLMVSASTRDEKQIYYYVFYELFTLPYNNSQYTLPSGELASTYDELLARQNYILYKYYDKLRSEQNSKQKIKQIRDLLNNMVDTLSYFLSGDAFRYVLSFVYTNSFDAIMKYIMLMINFFKSWKVYFLDPRVTYILDEKWDNTVGFEDGMGEIKTSLWTTGNGKLRDIAQVKPIWYAPEDTDSNPNRGAEVVDIAAHYQDNNIFKDRDYDGYTPEEVELPLGESSIIGENIIGSTSTGGGGDPYREDEGFVDLDGGGVALLDSAPYYMENGGLIAARRDVFDLNGGGVQLLSQDEITAAKAENENIQLVNLPDPEMSDYMIELDGGHVTANVRDAETGKLVLYNKETKTFNFENGDPFSGNFVDEQMFSVINGGGPDIRHVVTKTMITDISDYDEVSVTTRVSTYKYNGLTTLFNFLFSGLYEFALEGEIEIPEFDETNMADCLDCFDEDDGASEYESINYKNIEIYDFNDEDKDYEEELEDGLFFDTSKYFKAGELEELFNNIKAYKDLKTKQLLDLQDTLYAYTDPFQCYQRIERIFAEYFATTKEVLSLFKYNTFQNQIKNNIDNRINEFKNWFNDTEQFSNIYREFEEDLKPL